MFVLNNQGQVYVYQIEEVELARDDKVFQKQQIAGRLLSNSKMHGSELKNIKMISCGDDHFLALNQAGEVFAMGDDTFGQCGQGGTTRATVAPFYQKRVLEPKQIYFEEKIKKIVSGRRHNLAITETGRLFGWGYNNQI